MKKPKTDRGWCSVKLTRYSWEGLKMMSVRMRCSMGEALERAQRGEAEAISALVASALEMSRTGRGRQ